MNAWVDVEIGMVGRQHEKIVCVDVLTGFE